MSVAKAHYDELDGYRGIAALMVAACHVHVLYLVAFGMSESGGLLGGLTLGNFDAGVDLFFVLSGLLIAGPFVRSCLNATPLPTLGGYFLRRAARIIPAYYVAIIVVWILQGHNSWSDLLSHLTFTYVFREVSILSIIGPGWSVGVEVVYYVMVAAVAPLAHRACSLLPSPRARANSLLVCCSIGIVASVAYYLLAPRFVGLGPGTASIYFGPFARASCFLMGVALSVLAAPGEHRLVLSQQASRRLRLIGLLLVAAAFLARAQHPLAYHSFHSICGLGGTLILASTVLTADRGPWGRFLALPPLRWLGAVSYSVYLWHQPIIDGTVALGIVRVAPGQLWLGLATILSLTLVVAAASYYLIERPFLRLVRGRELKPSLPQPIPGDAMLAQSGQRLA